MKKYIKKILLKINFEIVRRSVIEELRSHKVFYQNAKDDITILKTLPNENASQIVSLLDKSKAQLRQDIFVLSHLNFKKMDIL